MRSSSAVKKEASGRKLSTVQGKTESRTLHNGFDRLRLVSELLSLGNDKITPELAHAIGEEVEAELKRRAAPQLSPELVSEIVQFKLEELGLIEIRRRRQKRPPSEAEELTVTLHPQEGSDAEESFSNHELGGLSAKMAAAKLPTLEKFLRPAAQDAVAAKSSRPLPPKASLKLSERTLRRLLASQTLGQDDGEIAARLETLFEEIAKTVAGAERHYGSANDPEILAVEFFNGMANQEFYPHLPILRHFLGDEQTDPASSAVRIEVQPQHDSIQSALEAAHRVWQEGARVVFSLAETREASDWTAESFAHFLAGVEGAVMSLAEPVKLPRSVGLRLALDRPLARDLVAEALSGKYYPKFQIELGLPAGFDPEGLSAEASAILQETWKKSEPRLVCLEAAFGASYQPPLGISESGHPDGAPALSLHEGASHGSLNLSIVGTSEDVDWAKLRRMTRTAVHFLDNLLDVLSYPDETLRHAATSERRIGLGVMGFAELLVKLGIPYDSEEAATLAEKVLRFIKQEATQASQAMAEQRGASREPLDSDANTVKLPLRHLALTAVVSEPFLAELAGVSAGIDPLSAILESGRVLPLLKLIGQRHRVWSDALERELLQSGSARACPSAPRPLRKLFATREELGAEWRMKILAACQRQCDAPLRAEFDLPESASFEDLREQLKQCLALGLKEFQLHQHPHLEISLAPQAEDAEAEGLPSPEAALPVETSAAEAVAASLVLTLENLAAFPESESPDSAEAANEALPVSEPDSELAAVVAEIPPAVELAPESLAAALVGSDAEPTTRPSAGLKPRPRPEILRANSRIIQTGCGPMHVHFARDEHGPYEVRAQLGQSGSCASAQTEAISRLLTLCLSTGVDQRQVYEQLRGIRCPKSGVDRGDKILSCADGIARVFERELGFSRKEPEELTPHFDDEDEITVVTKADALN